MNRIQNLSVSSLYEPLAFLGMAYLAGKSRIIKQFFPETSLNGLLFSASFASAATFTYDQALRRDGDSYYRAVMFKSSAIALATLCSWFIAKSLKERISLSNNSAIKLALLEMVVTHILTRKGLDIDSLLNRARAHLENRNYDDAVENLRLVLARAPNDDFLPFDFGDVVGDLFKESKPHLHMLIPAIEQRCTVIIKDHYMEIIEHRDGATIGSITHSELSEFDYEQALEIVKEFNDSGTKVDSYIELAKLHPEKFEEAMQLAENARDPDDEYNFVVNGIEIARVHLQRNEPEAVKEKIDQMQLFIESIEHVGKRENIQKSLDYFIEHEVNAPH